MQEGIKKLGIIIMSFGVSLPLLWIGIFKFTPSEANGIVNLVKSSAILSWMYQIFSVQITSNIIGTLEIIAGLGILGGLFSPKIGKFGSIIAILIFLTTSSFLFSSPEMFTIVDGIFIPSASGSLVLKDFSLLGISIFLLGKY